MLIVIAAKAKLEVGQRVAVEHGDDEWLLGVIQKLNGNRITFKYDNGDVENDKVSESHIKVIDPETPKSRKDFTEDQVDKMVPKKGKKPVPVNPPVVAPPAPVTRQGGTEDERAVAKFGSDALWEEAEGRKGCTDYVDHVWAMANKLVFGNRLRKPTLRWLKDMGLKSRRYGSYTSVIHVMALSPRIFYAEKQNIAVTTILHELCHAAVYVIDGIQRQEPNKGHGPLWEKWMRACGLTPSRFVRYDRADTMGDEDKEELERRRIALEKMQTVVRENGNQPIPRHELKPGAYVKYFSPNTDTWHVGILAAPNDAQWKRWILVLPGTKGKYPIIPTSWLMKPDANDLRLLADQQREMLVTVDVIQEFRRKGKGRRRQV